MTNAILDEGLQAKPLKRQRLSWLALSIMVFITAISLIFRMQHWPGAIEMELLGAGLLTGYLLAKAPFLPSRRTGLIVGLIGLVFFALAMIRYQWFPGMIMIYSGFVLLALLIWGIIGLVVHNNNKRLKAR